MLKNTLKNKLIDMKLKLRNRKLLSWTSFELINMLLVEKLKIVPYIRTIYEKIYWTQEIQN